MRILMFVTRYLCYASNTAFAASLSHELKDLGHEVEICNIMGREDAGERVAGYVGKSFDAVIDFNSTLPRAKLGDSAFLDEIDAPFYDFIVDHPLYHHPILKLPLKNFNVICLDKTHKAYIEKYYPHIRRILVLPLSGSKALANLDFKRRRNELLFTGTYYDPEKYRNMIEEKDRFYQREYFTMADILIENPLFTPNEAFDEMGRLLGHDKTALPPEDYRRELNAAYPAEIYARAIVRKQIMETILANGIPMIICGNEWEHFTAPVGSQITMIEGLDYAQSVELIASVQAVLNILPGFCYAPHDRIFTAMLNGAVAISDENDYLKNEFHHGEDCFLFPRQNLVQTIPQLKELLSREDRMKEISENGRRKASQYHTWKNRAEAFCEFLMEGNAT